jgi:hypothetical protein
LLTPDKRARLTLDPNFKREHCVKGRREKEAEILWIGIMRNFQELCRVESGLCTAF